jgi:hypothetical protein
MNNNTTETYASGYIENETREYDDYADMDIDDDGDASVEDTGFEIFEDIEIANQSAIGF